MIVVDTSVWIDCSRDRPEPHVEVLARLIDDDAGVAITDVVLAEVLQGVVTDQEARRVEARLAAFDVLRLESLDDFRNAATLYRRARSAGHTIRRTLNCLIAAVRVREDVAILHRDADFDRLASCSALRVHPVPSA